MESEYREEAERVLSPEQAEALIVTLKARFEKNRKLHEGIQWSDVESALRAKPEAMFSLSKMEETGGEPDVLRDEGDAFRFGDFSEESPSGRRNVVFNSETETLLRKHYRRHVFDGNAAGRVAEWGVEFMNEDEYRLLQQLMEVDVRSSSWLRTHADDSRSTIYYAFSGDRLAGYVIVKKLDVRYHGGEMGFRCSLRVPKSQKPPLME